MKILFILLLLLTTILNGCTTTQQVPKETAVTTVVVQTETVVTTTTAIVTETVLVTQPVTEVTSNMTTQVTFVDTETSSWSMYHEFMDDPIEATKKYISSKEFTVEGIVTSKDLSNIYFIIENSKGFEFKPVGNYYDKALIDSINIGDYITVSSMFVQWNNHWIRAADTKIIKFGR